MQQRLARLLTITLVINTLSSSAQSLATDSDPTRWINYSQTYYKLPIAASGIYRISTAELQQAGVPVGQLDPRTIQLVHRGVEQAVFVDGEADGRLDSDDFLEFYGRGNDGVPDSALYRPASAQPHTYYSLFNDTTAYFLTWRRDGKPGKRMVSYADTNTANLTPDTYHWAEDRRLFTENYPGWAAGIPPKIEYSYYETGEGYTGLIQQKDKPYQTTFLLSNSIQTGSAPQIDILLVGRAYTNHRVDGWVGPTPDRQRLADSVRFSTYDNAHLYPNVNWSDVSVDGRLVVSTVSRGENLATDAYSVSYIQLRYPQAFAGNGQAEQTFRLVKNPAGRSFINLTNVPTATRLWDITDPTKPIQIGPATAAPGSAQLVVHNTDTSRILLSTQQPKRVSVIQPVTFTNWHSRKANYLIISHQNLMKPVQTANGPTNAIQAYAAYRASVSGGGYDTLTVTMQQLIDQYSYGERHPLAIRRFAQQMLRQSKTALNYLVLIGQSRSTPGIRHDPAQSTLDMVMTAGFPGSDMLFTAGLEGPGLNANEPDVPAMPTGRINAGTPRQVLDYLNKVKEYEHNATNADWRKHLLHLSGGQTPGERVLFRQLTDSYKTQAIRPSLGARVTTIAKQTDELVEPMNVSKLVNEGVGLMTFFGHSGLDVTDLDIGFCSNDVLGYRNKGKYPLLLINGCAIGNFFFGRPTLTTDWVLTPDRGAIAAIAQSHLGYADVMHDYTTTFYNLLTDSTFLHKSIGQLQQETIRRVLAQTPDGRALANCQQMVLQGDPAIRLFPFETPDYVLTANGLSIRDADGHILTTETDSVQIRAIVQNTGQYRPGKLPVRVRRLVNGQESGVFNLLLPNTVAYRDTLTLTVPNNRNADGQNQFFVTINPADSPESQPETNHANNQATTELIIAGQKPVLIYPPPAGIVKTTAVRLSAIYFAEGPHVFDLEVDTTAQFNSAAKQTAQLTATGSIHYPATLLNRANTTYYWRVRLANKTGDSTIWATSSFTYAPDSQSNGLPEGQIRLAAPLPTNVQQGDVVPISVQFMNLSPYPFSDSLVVQQTIYAAGIANPQTTQWRVRAPLLADTVRFTTSISTEKLPGINRVVIAVNPRLQPESSYLNNTLDLPFFVQPDVVSPVLDVVVDGARITDDDVVSARPVIEVSVTDNNRSLIRRDTVGLDLFLQRPGKNAPFERLNWRSATYRTGADQVFRIIYAMPKLVEGTYRLFAAALDAFGNSAVPYQVRFRVMTEQKLTDLTVYPNPFGQQIRFSFYLTGEQAPDSLILTLTDLTGHVVRQLHPPARIGLNEWTWDGRDESGHSLPAGVYLYKLNFNGADAPAWPISGDQNGQLSGRIILNR